MYLHLDQFVSSYSHLEPLAFLPRTHRWLVGAPNKGSTLAQVVGWSLASRPTTSKGEFYHISQRHWSQGEGRTNKREDKGRGELKRGRERNKWGLHEEEKGGEAQG